MLGLTFADGEYDYDGQRITGVDQDSIECEGGVSGASIELFVLISVSRWESGNMQRVNEAR
jgi:hypothetical protein